MGIYLIISLILIIFNSGIVFYFRDEILNYFNKNLGSPVNIDTMGLAILIACFIPVCRWFFTLGLIFVVGEDLL